MSVQYKKNHSQFKYAAILLILMTLVAWPSLFILSCPISSHCWDSPSNCKILSRRSTSQPPAQNIVIVINTSQQTVVLRVCPPQRHLYHSCVYDTVQGAATMCIKASLLKGMSEFWEGEVSLVCRKIILIHCQNPGV